MWGKEPSIGVKKCVQNQSEWGQTTENSAVTRLNGQRNQAQHVEIQTSNRGSAGKMKGRKVG